MPLEGEVAPVEVGHEVGGHRGRHGEVAVVMMNGGVAYPSPVGIILFDDLVEVLDFVLREGEISGQLHPGSGIPGAGQLDAETVGVLDVGGQGLADVGYFTREYKLVVVVHEVEVGPHGESFVAVLVAGLPVEQFLGLGSRVGTVVGEVVAGGLAMAHGERCVSRLSVFLPGDTCLGVEEMIAFVNIENLVVQPGC